MAVIHLNERLAGIWLAAVAAVVVLVAIAAEPPTATPGVGIWLKALSEFMPAVCAAGRVMALEPEASIRPLEDAGRSVVMGRVEWTNIEDQPPASAAIFFNGYI